MTLCVVSGDIVPFIVSDDLPGPGHYKVMVSCRPDAKSAPKYTLKGRFETIQSK